MWCSVLTQHHGSHRRKVKELPILGKRVTLDMQMFDYQCDSDRCHGSSVTETFNGFLNYNSRMTERLEDFICLLAIDTSCESTTRIMRSVNVCISGDTVIRLLTKRFSKQESPVCGSAVGIDDFAYKNGILMVPSLLKGHHISPWPFWMEGTERH